MSLESKRLKSMPTTIDLMKLRKPTRIWIERISHLNFVRDLAIGSVLCSLFRKAVVMNH